MPSVVQFLHEARDELQRVSWPDRRQTVRLTLVVVGVSFLVGVYLSGLDFVLTKGLELIVGR